MSNQLSQETLRNDIRLALRQWKRRDSSNRNALSRLRLIQNLRRESSQESLDPVEAAIESALERLRETHDDLASILKSHYLDGKTTTAIAIENDWSQATANRRLSMAVEYLSDILYREEMAARAAFDAQLSLRIGPPSYNRLIGADAALNQLSQLLRADEPAKIILLAGTGGIGKTRLADALIRRIAHDNLFADFGWVTAKQHLLDLDGDVRQLERPGLTADECIERLGEQFLEPALLAAKRHSRAELQSFLRERLAALPHLVVIDNLETLADVGELLPLLRQLAGPAKFILTSRQAIPAASDVFYFKIPELSEQDALALVRSEAMSRNLDFIATIDDGTLRPIYRIVGGNPLALRLVVGQLPAHNLSIVLERLLEAEGQPIENLYEFIYAQTWDGLSRAGRSVLLAMPLLPPAGGSFSQIVAISGLPEYDVYDGIYELVTASLVDRKGGLHDSYYTIHALTRSFLHKAVLQWQ